MLKASAAMPCKLISTVAITLATLGLTACGQKDNPPAAGAEVTIKVGHAAPLTGPQAHLGKDNEHGAVMAIDELNSRGLLISGSKVKFVLISEDDQADPKTGTTVAQKFVDQKVNGVIGHLNSGTTIPASRIYSDAGIPQISGSATNPTYTQQGFKTTFRVFANDVHQGQALAQFATQSLKAKTIAIVDDRTAYGQGLADEFKKAAEAGGAKIVTQEFTTDKATDFKAILTKIKAVNPDVLFFSAMDAQGGPALKQARELGLKATFLIGDGGCTPEFIKLAGKAAEGQYCSLPGVPLEKMPGGTVFKDKYQQRFNQQIQLYAPYVYDAVMVMADAMQRANSADPAKYLPEVGKSQYQGVTAKIVFDAKGDLASPAVSIYQDKGGNWSFVETVGAPEAVSSAPPAAATKK